MKHTNFPAIALLLCFTPHLTNCSPALTSSAPKVAPLESLPSSFPLDAVAVSELLAGVEVELGEERGKTAAALERNELLEQALKKAQRLAIMYPVLAGAIGTVLGAIIGAVAVFIGTSVR